MIYLYILIAFFLYEVFSICLFFWSWSNNGKNGPSKWYDYLWVPGVFLIAFPMGWYARYVREREKVK